MLILVAGCNKSQLDFITRRGYSLKDPRVVTTIVEPVGVSILTLKMTPNADTSVPIVQPIANRGPIRSAKTMAPTLGTIR
jgi:hypothetical protein